MGEQRLLLHVGYHKTGSTWLQKRFFDDPRFGFERLAKNFAARPALVHPSALEFDRHDAADLIAQVEDASANDRIPVISDERLSGNPFSGGFDSKEIAERLAAVFPAAKILIVVREQRDVLYSVYDEYVREGGACGIETFLNPPTRYAIPPFRLGHFRYHRLVELYQRLFGVENVRVLAYEQFAQQPESFLEDICEYAGVKSDHQISVPNRRDNARRAPSWLAVQRRLNYFIRADDLNAYSIFAIRGIEWRLSKLIDQPPKIQPQWLDRRIGNSINDAIDRAAAGEFAASNRALAELVDIDLAAFGYEV
ncbi:MAG: sulfotransferase [Pseudomonadota bacterium]